MADQVGAAVKFEVNCPECAVGNVLLDISTGVDFSCDGAGCGWTATLTEVEKMVAEWGAVLAWVKSHPAHRRGPGEPPAAT
jgi:hypothetical protein